MESGYCNLTSQHCKTSARKVADPRNRGLSNNSSQSHGIVSSKDKPQGDESAAKDCAVWKRQQFFHNPNPWKGKRNSSESPSSDNSRPRHTVQYVSAQQTVLNMNQRHRGAIISNKANDFEQFSDEESVYENLDAYWHQPHYQRCNDKVITYTTPSELFVSAEKRMTLSKPQMQMSDSSTLQPPPLPAKFRRQRFAVGMSGSISEVDSSSSCSQQLSSTSEDSAIFNSEESSSSIDSDNRTYVNLAEVCSSTTFTEILNSVSEKLMASQGKPADQRSLDNSKPPPLPKKTLSRTNSAPGGSQLGLTRSLPCSPGLQISNPLYGVYEQKTSNSTPCSPMNTDEKFNLPSSYSSRRSGMIKSRSLDGSASYYHDSKPQKKLEKLNFCISDLELRNWFNFENQVDMFRMLTNQCVISLQSICEKYNAFFMDKENAKIKFSDKDWPDFKLSDDEASCDSRDAIYYRVQYTLPPKDEFALKVAKSLNQESLQTEPCGLSLQDGLPRHFNVQMMCGHFIATIPTKLLPPEDAALSPDNSETEKNGSGPEAVAETSKIQPNGSTNQRPQVVIITQEVPSQTMADFVKESAALHETQADVYERQVSLLLLQLCLGLEHLKDHNVTHCDLRLENLLLVKVPAPRGKAQSNNLQLPRLIISNFSKAKQNNTATDQKLHPDQTRLAPEIMSTTRYKKVDEFQLGILIYEVLHMSNPIESISNQKEYEEYKTEELPQIPQRSVYSKGLQHLSHLLLRADPSERIHIHQAKSILQALLWGPCPNVFSLNTGFKDPPQLLTNWLDVKRVLLMLKFGEIFLDDVSQENLEDWLCCQYFAFATPNSVHHALEVLQILLEEGC
ncbi:inactive tyrosine-protein kinase PEAK1 isoform X2 [Scyliorhinus torazame]